MHSSTIVLLPPGTTGLWEAGVERLKPHRLDEDGPPGQVWHLDYWTVGDERLDDAETAAALGVADDSDLAKNVSIASRLPPDFRCAAVVTPDGVWHDLFDRGRTFPGRDTPECLEASDRWDAEVRDLLAAYPDHIVVEFDTHS